MIERLGTAIAGVAASTALVGGLYGLEQLGKSQQLHAEADCGRSFEAGEDRNICMRDARNEFGGDSDLGLLKFAGTVGVLGFGYLAYKGVKADMKTTGLVEDIRAAQ